MNTIRNFVTLVGNMGSDAKITEFDNGQRVARFQLSTQKSLRKNNGRYTAAVEWHRLFAWGNMAQFIEKYGDYILLKTKEIISYFHPFLNLFKVKCFKIFIQQQ